MTTVHLSPEKVSAVILPSFIEIEPQAAFALSDLDLPEALSLLAERPIHTAFLRCLLADNGLDAALNRGIFYGYRNAENRLEGVALIGASTLFESLTPAALRAFARLARDYGGTQTLLLERAETDSFIGCFDAAERGTLRLHSRELLLAADEALSTSDPVEQLRVAEIDDLELVTRVHAAMYFEATGIDPLAGDPTGFGERCRRRTERGRTWVWRDGERLIFKADLVADTPEAIYVEAIYVNHEERRKGYGQRCLSQLINHLLRRTRHVSLLVSEENLRAQSLYAKLGLKFLSYYDTIFLQPPDPAAVK